MDNLLTIEPGMIIWTFITFGLLIYILKKVGWKPLLNALEKREERIHNDIQRAEHAREETEKLLGEHRKMMASAELEARRIIEDARTAAETIQNDIVANAQEQAHRMTEQAKTDIKRETATALSQLRSEIADLAVMAASKILKEQLDADKHKKLIDDFISEFPRN